MWHVNEITVHLALWAPLNELITICLHGKLEITYPHNLSGQHVSSYVWAINSCMNLSHHLIYRGMV